MIQVQYKKKFRLKGKYSRDAISEESRSFWSMKAAEKFIVEEDNIEDIRIRKISRLKAWFLIP